MSIAAIAGAVEAAATAAAAPLDGALARTVAAPAPGFGDWFAKELSAVNTTLVGADHEAQQLASGEVQNLHQVMIHMEEAKLSFQLLAQVRNHLLDAYQEVMRMQV